MKIKIKKVNDSVVDKKENRDFFILGGYDVKFINGKYHCNGLSFDNYKNLKFAVNYFNKKFISL
jgi:hypothetical protein